MVCTGCNAEGGLAAEESICTDMLERGMSGLEHWFVVERGSVGPKTLAGKKSLPH